MRLTVGLVVLLFAATAAVAEMTPGTIVTKGEPFPIVADFNGDGLDDLVQGRNILINDGTSFAQSIDLGIDAPDKVIAVLDANGDGRLDLLVEGGQVAVPPQLPQPPPQSPGYRLYLADESGTFGNAVPVSSGTRPYVADVNDDGLDDLVIFTPYRPNGRTDAGTDISVGRSQGDGTFAWLPAFRISASSPQMYPVYRVPSGDLNRDGHPDLVLRCVQDLVILLGSGNGRFRAETRFLPVNADVSQQSIRLGDIDGDSNLDLVMPGYRSLRVLFGDGKGKFPRATRTLIAKTHEATGLPFPMEIDRYNQPRNIALGHFTRRDRLQIAAGTGEGDLVVYSYENAALREVSRTVTEYWMLDIRTGAFRGTGVDDLYVTGTLIWGEPWPRPRLFYGHDHQTAAVTSPQIPRRRASAGGSVQTTTSMQLAMQGDCVGVDTVRWQLTRDGIFGSDRRGEATIETVFFEDLIIVRLNTPQLTETAYVVLQKGTGSEYHGNAALPTSCGLKVATINATVE